MRKADIDMRYYDNKLRPVVNVKVPGGGYDWDRQIDAMRSADFARGGMDAAWIRANLTEDDQEFWYQRAIEDGWERLTEDARYIFDNPSLRVYSYGRSSGWAGMGDFDADSVASWDAIAVSRWGQFSRACASAVASLPYDYALLVYMNVYEPAQERQREQDALVAHALGISV